MSVLMAVLKDLYLFAFKYWFGFIGSAKDKNTNTKEINKETQEVKADAILQIPPQAEQPLLLSDTKGGEVKVDTETSDGEKVYVNKVSANLYILPTRTFDGVLLKLTYKQVLQVINRQGQWYCVLCGQIKGWIHNDDITDSLAALEPRFVAGEIYDADHKNSVTVRILIDDQFSATDLDLPLQDVEYVTYRLSQKNRHITWPKDRPRIAGTWQRLLKGSTGLHLSIEPKNDTVMEYINEDNTGHVAYVDSVFPDGTISLSEVGYPTEAMYTKRTLGKDEWKELRPVFIEVA